MHRLYTDDRRNAESPSSFWGTFQKYSQTQRVGWTTKPVHILHISNYAPPYGGGIQFVMASLALRAVAAGHRVTLLAADTGIPRGESVWQGIERVGIPASNLLERRNVPFPLFDPVALVRALNRLLPQVDVVHLHGFLYLDTVIASILAQRAGRRVILTEHVGIVPYQSATLNMAQALALQILGRVTVRNSAAVVVLNQRVAREMQPLKRDSTPILTIPNGVDSHFFHPPADRDSLRARLGVTRPILLFAGRAVEKKGIQLVLAAARALPDLEVVVCGQDTELLKDVPASVRIVGKVDQATLCAWYGAADALILPSEGEGFPLVLQEALACGLPVIITDDETNRDYVNTEVALFVQRDAEDIRLKVQELFADTPRLARMRTAARAWALAQLDWDGTTVRYLELYRGDVVGQVKA